MKIAIPTNDRINLAERSGRAKEFAIFEFDNSELKSSNFIKNTHSHDDDNHNHTHKDIVEKIADCDLFIAKKAGKHLANDLNEAGIKIKITKLESINDVLKKEI